MPEVFALLLLGVAVALGFASSRFFTGSTILGATSVAQLDELARYFDTRISAELLADLEEVNRTYPSPAAQ